MRAYERLIRYARFETASDEACASCPSTGAQAAFARYLCSELSELGVFAQTDEHGYVYARIPANVQNAPRIGFIAHLDVSPDAPCTDVRTRLIEKYDGGDIPLCSGVTLSPSEFPELSAYKGQSLVVTDGKTLLGADDKAGIAEIITLAERLSAFPEIKHGDVLIAFTPDEEIGRGADFFNVSRFGAHFAYTVDGGAFGQIQSENFNAASADIAITGKSIHPGEAKGRMINAASVAAELDGMLPADERPQTTEGRQGFFHLTDIRGSVSEARMKYILRDHDTALLEKRKSAVLRAAARVNEKYGGQVVSVSISDSYRNMAQVLEQRPEISALAAAAVTASGGTPCFEPIRGGTDGARLSFMGLPCPNLGTGSHNHHGVFEYACVQAMDSCVDSLVNIVENAAKMID